MTVSVIIPTYNRLHYLRRAIDSVMKQTFDDYELLVIDDASTDESDSFVRSCIDPRIQYHRHEKNMGAPAARNTGLRLAKGEFIAFLDSDNEWLPQRLEKQVELFARSSESVGVIYANNRVIDEINQTESIWAFSMRGNLYRELLQHPFMDFITPLIRRSCFDKIGMMDENVPSYQEWDTFLRIAKYYEFDYVPDVLAVYHVHSNSRISERALNEAAGWQYVFEKHRDEMLTEMSSRVLIEHHRNLARIYKQGHAYGRMAKNVVLWWYYKKFA